MRPAQIALISLVMGGCLRLQLRDEDQPIAVGATFRPLTTNWRLQCEGGDLNRCRMVHAHIRSIDAPEDLFATEGSRVIALDEGSGRIHVHATIGSKERSRRMTLESAFAHEISVASLGDINIEAFVAPPGATIQTGWAATARDGRRLIGESFLAWDDPTGVVDVQPTERGPGIEMLMPDTAQESVDLIGDNGLVVATVRVDTPEPDFLELLFDPGWGDLAQAQLIGWSGSFAILYSDVPVRWSSLTPEICEAPFDGVLGSPAYAAILQAGNCTLEASADLPGAPFETTLTASARVAPAIPRSAP